MTSREPTVAPQQASRHKAPRAPRVTPFAAIVCGVMILGGLGLMWAGNYLRQHLELVRVPLPAIEHAGHERAQRTVTDVVTLLGGFLMCFGMIGGARALRRRSSPTERRRAVQPAPAGTRPFTERLDQYLDEQPTPAVGIASERRGPVTSFLAKLPGARHAPKSRDAIRRILLHIRQLLRGGT